jgi:DNA-binding NtrC family response regulator
MLLCKMGQITLDDLPNTFKSAGSQEESLMSGIGGDLSSWKGKTLPEVQSEVLDQVEKLYLNMILKETKGRVGQAAKLSGIHSRGLYSKMKRLGIKKEKFRAP